jgi:hypothetical protein
MPTKIQLPDFTVWNRDKNEMWEELQGFLNAGHKVTLRMTTSTSLTRDLAWVILISNAIPRCERYIFSRKDEWEEVRIMVSLWIDEPKKEASE